MSAGRTTDVAGRRLSDSAQSVSRWRWLTSSSCSLQQQTVPSEFNCYLISPFSFFFSCCFFLLIWVYHCWLFILLLLFFRIPKPYQLLSKFYLLSMFLLSTYNFMHNSYRSFLFHVLKTYVHLENLYAKLLKCCESVSQYQF
jgi:hypothetical protein